MTLGNVISMLRNVQHIFKSWLFGFALTPLEKLHALESRSRGKIKLNAGSGQDRQVAEAEAEAPSNLRIVRCSPDSFWGKIETFRLEDRNSVLPRLLF